TITWGTDYPATSMVKYETSASPTTVYNDTVLQTSHSVTLSLPGLFPGDGYWYTVASYDCVANKVESLPSPTIGIPYDPIPACGTPIVCTDNDGDTFNKEGGACGSIDCNDNNASINPGAAEVCNRIDDDCTGLADDGITPSTEVCDGIDNNCDGSIDEGISSSSTTCGVGACGATGTLSCVCGAMVDSCTPGTPSAEVCDGIDNDCNGLIDDIPPTPITCGVGACASTGILTCIQTIIIDTCVPFPPSPEVCDGIDNDCNGATDDGIASTPTTCGVGACASTGTLSCVGGVLVDSCTPGTPSPEVCDGIDNDCNGVVDDGIPSTPTTCGVGACASTGTLLSCVGGVMVDSCTPGAPGTEGPGDATCSDFIDNDCDGFTDGTDSGCLGVDYDVMGFRCSHGTSVGGTTTIKVVIKNQGTIDTGALLTVSGMQGGTLIPITAGMSVSDPVGGGRTTYTFSYIPVTTGNILWSIALVDGDPDFDNGLCTTIVK
ncbi:MAG: putative metal-binding motif-containing protein, partial [Nitrospirota bacterium]